MSCEENWSSASFDQIQKISSSNWVQADSWLVKVGQFWHRQKSQRSAKLASVSSTENWSTFMSSIELKKSGELFKSSFELWLTRYHSYDFAMLFDAQIWPEDVGLSSDIDICEVLDIVNVLIEYEYVSSCSFYLHCHHIKCWWFSCSISTQQPQDFFVWFEIKRYSFDCFDVAGVGFGEVSCLQVFWLVSGIEISGGFVWNLSCLIK